MMYTGSEVLSSQILFLSIATVQVTYSVLNQFIYRANDNNYWFNSSSDNYYVNDTDSSSMWKFANFIKNYSRMAAYGFALITQILAQLGIAQAFNEKVWVYGIFVEAISIDIVYLIMACYALGKIYN